MSMFGSARDVATFKIFSKELVEDIISQEIGYYKIKLGDTKANIYGESLNKYFIGPVLIPCLIVRGEFNVEGTEYGPDSIRTADFRFFKDHLIEANIVPEIGDTIMYNELYYEVDNVNENQFILGKNPDYQYSNGPQNFGQSYSIILTTHLSSPDKLGITKERL
jgi:hypothetical protein